MSTKRRAPNPARKNIPEFEELEKIAEKSAAYVARDQSRMSIDDLRQEAWVALLSFAVPFYDPALGPFRPWAWRSIVRPLVWAACRQEKPHARREEIERRVDWHVEDAPLEEQVEARLWRARVVEVIREILEEPGVEPADVLVLSQERTVVEHAKIRDEPPGRVRKRCAELRTRIARSSEVRRLYEEMR